MDVDVVPVYCEEDGDWGYLVSQEDGTKLITNITLHKEFITKYRQKYKNYTQAVRLLKWWSKTRKAENPRFKFKSFMVELVLAKLFDENEIYNPDDYPEIMLSFFDYIAKTDFNEMIYFTDYAKEPQSCNDPIRVFDPVNPENNVARKYNNSDKEVIINEAVDAGDAIEAALRAPTKGLTLEYWRKVFGTSFTS